MPIHESPELIVSQSRIFCQVNQAIPILASLSHLTYHPVGQLLSIRKGDRLALLHLESFLMLISELPLVLALVPLVLHMAP